MRDQISGKMQPLVCEIAMDRKAGTGPEGAHHMVFTEIKLLGESVDADIIRKMLMQIL